MSLRDNRPSELQNLVASLEAIGARVEDEWLCDDDRRHIVKMIYANVTFTVGHLQYAKGKFELTLCPTFTKPGLIENPQWQATLSLVWDACASHGVKFVHIHVLDVSTFQQYLEYMRKQL